MRLEDICKGRVTSPLGWRVHPITGEKQFHNGVDVSARQGTEVFSPMEAQVASVYRHLTGGLTLILKGKEGMRVGMCHLQCVLVRVGDVVCVGDCVAKVGCTGRVTGAHLHLTVSVDGNWLDPQEVFKG